MKLMIMVIVIDNINKTPSEVIPNFSDTFNTFLKIKPWKGKRKRVYLPNSSRNEYVGINRTKRMKL